MRSGGLVSSPVIAPEASVAVGYASVNDPGCRYCRPKSYTMWGAWTVPGIFWKVVVQVSILGYKIPTFLGSCSTSSKKNYDHDPPEP